MKRNKKKKMVLLVIFLVLLAVITGVLFFVGRSYSKKQKIGFIITGTIDETGWNGMHYEGALAACKELDAELLVKENVREFEGKCESAIEELVNQGCKMIILTSFGYVEEVRDVIERHSDVSFYCNTFNFHADNATSFFVRMYQARYLAGIVAGMQTQTDKIGYVAAMPNSEVNRGINAFVLGVRSVNPTATVTVAWSNDWDNEEEERKQADNLIYNKGVDVITYHQNKAYVAQEAEKAGICSIGYHQKLDNGSDKYLTTVVCDWKLAYEAIIKQYMRGNSEDIKVYWVGMEENAVKLDGYSSLVSAETKKEIDKAEKRILAGQDVFSGAIYDNEGTLRCKENQTISDEVLLEKFDWYVEGVDFYDK